MATITNRYVNGFRHFNDFVRLPLNLLRVTRSGLYKWQERYQQRRQLLGLSDAMLKDIGLSRADVDGEVRKPFWRP